jgi:uncharacterized membrane protein YGL010W
MTQPVTWNDRLERYAESHQHPANRFCHTFGIPLVAGSVPLAILSPFVPGLWMAAAGGFVAGWILQFVGHAFEGKRPAFVGDGRFLLVGLLWWFKKIGRGAP